MFAVLFDNPVTLLEILSVPILSKGCLIGFVICVKLLYSCTLDVCMIRQIK